MHPIQAWLQPLADRGHKPTQFILKHGRFFEAQALPAGIQREKAGVCYANAGKLVLEFPQQYGYVEGYALAPNLIPLPHAWCLDANGRVVDTTWDTPQACTYFGIHTDTEFMLDFVTQTGYWGLFESPLFWRNHLQEPERMLAQGYAFGFKEFTV